MAPEEPLDLHPHAIVSSKVTPHVVKNLGAHTKPCMCVFQTNFVRAQLHLVCGLLAHAISQVRQGVVATLEPVCEVMGQELAQSPVLNAILERAQVALCRPCTLLVSWLHVCE